MLYVVILICFFIIIYALKEIMNEILKIRADVEFLKEEKANDMVKHVVDLLNK